MLAEMGLNDRLEILKIFFSIAIAILLFASGLCVMPNTPSRRILKLLLLLAFAITMGNVASALNLGKRPVPWPLAVGMGMIMLFCFVCLHPEKLIMKRIEKNILDHLTPNPPKDKKIEDKK